MSVSAQISALFAKHGQPHEDHRLTVSLLVLIATQQERLLSTSQDLTNELATFNTNLSNLASGITSLVQKISAPAAPALIDQATLDSVVAGLNSANGQISNMVSQITAAMTPAPAPAAPPTPAPAAA